MKERKGATTTAILLLAALLLTPLAGCAETSQTIETQTRTTIPPDAQGDAASSNPSISADGRFVAFKSDATNLVVESTNGARSIYVKNIQTGATTRVSAASNGDNGNKDSDDPVISGDGRFVAFDSLATNLTAGDANSGCLSPGGANINCSDVFIKNLESGETRLVSATGTDVQGNRESEHPAISANGRFVAFRSGAGNLVAGDSNGKTDVFIKDMQTGSVTRASVTADGTEGDGDSLDPAISADGRYVAFRSQAGNLAPGDSNGKLDVFLKDTQTGALALVSAAAGGEQGNETSGFSSLAISVDGHFVVFDSGATNLVDGDENGKRDIFIKDMKTGSVALVSASVAGVQGEEDSYAAVAVSAEGRFVAFSSDAPNLAPGDINAVTGKTDIFLKDMQTGAISLISAAAGTSATTVDQGRSGSVSISGDGRYLAFDSDAANLTPGDTNKKTDVFVRDTAAGSTVRVSTSTADLEAGADTIQHTSEDTLGNSGTIGINR